MLGKSLTPVIGKIARRSCIPASGSGELVVDGSISPRSPLDLKSPRGPKSYDLGVVGLAIVAALENSCQTDAEFLAYRPVYNRRNSNPIPVNSCRSSPRLAGYFDETDTECSEDEEDEEYTVVTCHGPGNKSYTRVYCDRAVINGSYRSSRSKWPSVFAVSPARTGGFPRNPDSGFLSSCDMCQKSLHGIDIFMYRGEKAFCSSECRNRQILTEECNEKCSSEISRSVDVSSSNGGQTFSGNGILAI
ncbi:unnamed protein product [Cuscuta epithymum]|uniref:FLZ-type domain-containing protein n=1 Tax=Cuscuta epithymum TaxID=186058 RepID=A0AAV0DSQ4_9ASTE|nr:unnamed protein product [Cuscuta epithymum]